VQNIRNQVAKGIAWLAGARAITNIVALCGTLLLARFLTPDDFGLVAIAMSITSIIISVTELSLSSAMIH
jgi:PST family polysaccharide transporter